MSENDDPGTDDGWDKVPGVDEPVELIEFDTLDFVNELTHPVRAQIMRQLKRPKTAADIAETLDVPVTRLYHHLKRLEKAELIRVVATRKVAAVTERRYQVVALSMGVDQRFFESLDTAEVVTALGSIFDIAKLGMQREFEAGTIRVDEDDDSAVLSLSHISLSSERRDALMGRLHDLIAEFTADTSGLDESSVRVALFIAAHPESS